MMNSVNIVGRLVRDIDLRYTPSGVAVGNGTVAANRPFKNQAGENEADFINIVIWRKAAENTANYTSKGSLVGVTGRLQSRRYDDKDGKTVFVTEVVAESVQFLDSKSDNKKSENNTSYENKQQQPSQNQTTDTSQGEPIDIHDDDLPF
ncbi:MAG TPA: single-stranded DNA-binding protein [Pseudogracilibacillus sp.]|nr:single-stranded DNA-binding protein [Pseudogracilibacillus sp.]